MKREQVKALVDSNNAEVITQAQNLVPQLAREWLKMYRSLEIAQSVLGHTTLYARKIKDDAFLEWIRGYLLDINKTLAEINPEDTQG